MRSTAFLDVTLALARPALDPAVRDAYRAPYRGARRRGAIGAFVEDIPLATDHVSRAELDRIAEGARSLGTPALMLWGPEDPIFSDRYLDDLIDRMPHADVHRFEGAGHLIAEDVDWTAAVADWLETRLPSDGRDRASTAAAEPAGPAETADAAAPAEPAGSSTCRPLWAVLDERSSSDEIALVEMAARGGTPLRVSWRLLARRVTELAAGLSASGVRPGDRVSLLVPPGADLTAALYACLRLGATVVVADAGLGLRGLTRAVRGARPDVVIGAVPGLAAARALRWPGRRLSVATLPRATAMALGVESSLPRIARLGRGRPLPDVPDAEATAAVLFTSGSTGPAKGVVYTHEQLEALRDALATRYGIAPGTGLVAGFAPFALLGPALGARSATPDMDVTSPRTLTAVAVARAVAEVGAEVLFLSPAALANVVETQEALLPGDAEALTSVRTFLSAGAPIPRALLEKASRLFPGAEAHTPYGMTEGLLMTDIDLDGIRAAESDPDDSARGGVCVGLETETTSVAVSPLDGEGRATGEATTTPGVTGEILVSAPHLKQRYDRLWRTDREAGRSVGDRWHRTGDVGRLDSSGQLWVEGRLPHVVVTAAGVVTPVGPEQRVERVQGVARAALASVGPRGTAQAVVVVETTPLTRRPGLAPSELAVRVRAAAGIPVAAVLVVPSIPVDIRHNSKIDRSRLSRWAEGVLAGGRMTSP